MSKLREPNLGPIVGHTSETSSRIWIRGEDPGDKGAKLVSERRTIGIIAVVEINGKAVPNIIPYYFRLHRKHDRTGTFHLGVESCLTCLDEKGSNPLKPGTEYKVKVGTLTLDDPFDDGQSVEDDHFARILPPADVWAEDLKELDDTTSAARFTTFKKGNALSFVVGSCRYPGIFWKVKDSDRIFGPMLKETQTPVNKIKPSFVLMVGDQIYADKLNRHVPLGLADTFEEFQERYLSAFGSRNMRKLLQSIPNYMILDDHEIEDNWSQDRLGEAQARKVFHLAIGSYRSYQWCHSPRNYGDRLYYDFNCGNYPFFVIDTRTQRYMDDIEDDLADNHLLGRPAQDKNEPNQLDLLLAWLSAQDKKVPKFIVSSSVFAPNPIFAREGRFEHLEGEEKLRKDAKAKQKSDSWPAFPHTRRAILQKIVDENIQNVIFVSGDIHCSNVAEIEFSGTQDAKKLKAFSITSSAFYWPFPFADGDPNNFVHNSTKKETRDTFVIQESGGAKPLIEMNYKAWNFTQKDNFCRVDINKKLNQIKVTPYDAKGNIITNSKGKKLVSTLKLSSW